MLLPLLPLPRVGPPAGAQIGERINIDGIPEGTAATPNQLNKQGKKSLEFVLTGGELLVS